MKRKIVIKKGRHYPFPGFPIGQPYLIKDIGLTCRMAEYLFTDSCMYDLKDEDQHDVNKLFGFSIGCHHENSFRFGWRPILKNNTIEIVAYEYNNGVRMATISLCEVELNKWHQFRLQYHPHLDEIYYYLNEDAWSTNFTKNIIKPIKKWGYTLGAYFGGNEKAPHDIVICRKNAKSYFV